MRRTLVLCLYLPYDAICGTIGWQEDLTIDVKLMAECQWQIGVRGQKVWDIALSLSHFVQELTCSIDYNDETAIDYCIV